MSTHLRAYCRGCAETWEGDKAPNAAEKHTKTTGHVTVQSMHPRHLCTPECSTKETRP